MMTPDEPARLLRNWRDELDSAALYAALAQIERDPQQRGVYQELESAERRHAVFWEERMRAAGQTIPPFHAALRTRILIQLARRLGIGFVVPGVIVREMKDRDAYADQQPHDGRRGRRRLDHNHPSHRGRGPGGRLVLDGARGVALRHQCP
jgi:hypothetical protein